MTKGGFPPFLLPLVTFEGLHAARAGRTAAGGAAPRSTERAVARRGDTDTRPRRRARQPIAVLGAGSWGTALAVHLARTGHRDRAVGHRDATSSTRWRASAAQQPLPAGRRLARRRSTIEHDFARAVARRDELLIVVPSHALPRGASSALAPLLRTGQRVAWATKGFELDTGKLPHEVASEVLGPGVPTAVLSGPDVREGSRRGPADGDDRRLARRATTRWRSRASSPARISAPTPRPTSIGVEVGGATKNVLAIGAGISDGLGFGANTRVALITRGLAEMMRLGVALGARQGHVHGPRRARRPRADLHRRPVAQPPLRPGARRRQVDRPRRSARSARWSKACSRHARSATWRAVTASRCRSPSRSTACSTKASPPREAVVALMNRAIKSETGLTECACVSRHAVMLAAAQRPRQPSCRQASYTATATAFDRFRLRAPSSIGIRSRRSTGQASSTASGRPRVSAPNTSASPRSNLAES